MRMLKRETTKESTGGGGGACSPEKIVNLSLRNGLKCIKMVNTGIHF